MLTCLRVRDLAIIDELELELDPGLNIITGETGAGKSILIAALELVLGARGNPQLVRAGAEEAVVEALFDLSATPALARRVAELTGTEDDELLVRRVLRPAGRSRAYVNGSLATASQLSRLARGLVDICSQHAHHSLSDVATHLDFLDDFAELKATREEMAAAWGSFQEAAAALERLAEAARQRVEREAILRFQLDEIDEVDPVPDEEDELESEHERLAHADQLARVTARTERALYSDDDALVDVLSRLAHDLDSIRGVDEDLDPLIERLDAARTDLEDLAQDLGTYQRGVVHDPARLREVDERLGALRRLARKYGGTHTALLQRQKSLREELSTLMDVEGQLERLEARRQATGDAAGKVARTLSAGRRAAAESLGASITEQLQSLGMGGARVEVDVARLARSGALEIDGAHVNATGMDRVEFLIAPNVGEPPKALHKVASGGELSRSLLAIKRVLAGRGPRGFYVFDEVDTGVGGAVAEVIGRKLDEVARHHQVLCITHQPQIAAYADRHVYVSKGEAEGRTRSQIDALDRDGRVQELARMMGGIELTEATHQAAADLIEAASRARG